MSTNTIAAAVKEPAVAKLYAALGEGQELFRNELLDDALAYIRAHPEEWDQAEWVCGTTACLAGHLVMLGDGATIEDLHRMEGAGDGDGPCISERARQLLGLPRASNGAGDVTAMVLFGGSNSLDDLERFVGHVKAGHRAIVSTDYATGSTVRWMDADGGDHGSVYGDA